MGRIVKLLGIVVAAIVVLLVGATLFITMFVDPNDYKDQISAAVSESTGREFELTGDLEFSVFPSLRIAVGPASLSNAAGFGAEPFASIEGAELQVALLPLLSERLEISRASLQGLNLNLMRNAQGRNNWQDLGSQSTGESAGPGSSAGSEGGAANLALDIASIAIDDARVAWRDAQTGNDWVLDNFTMEADDFGQGTAFPLRMTFELAGDAITVAVVSDMNATLDLAQNNYRLEDLTVDIDGSGSAWPGGEGSAELQFDAFVADLNAQTISLQNLQLAMLGLNVTGTLQGTNVLSDLALGGAINIAQFDPRGLMEAFDAEIETADSAVLGRASASAEFAYNAREVSLSNLRLELDDSSLTGRVAIVGTRFDFDLDVDAINIDRYLPPATEEVAEADEGSLDEVDLPIQPLRNFNARGNLAFAAVQFMGLSFTDADFDLRASNGRLSLAPSGSMYGGSYSGNVVIEVVGEAARLSLQQTIDGIDMAPFARDFLDSDMISGTGDLSLDVSATGANLGAIRRALNGDVAFEIANGAWEGTDVWFDLRRLSAVSSGGSAPARPAGPRRTPFTSIAATGALADSVLTNNDLTATLQYMSVAGSGTANILTDAINFDLTARFADNQAFENAPELANLAGAQLPLTVTGTLAAPSIRPDFGAVVRARAQQEVQERVEEEKEDLRDRVRDRLRGLLE